MIDNDYREVDTDEKNVSDVEETKEGTPVETGEVVTDDSTEDNEKTDDFDEFCAMCRRPASKARQADPCGSEYGNLSGLHAEDL